MKPPNPHSHIRIFPIGVLYGAADHVGVPGLALFPEGSRQGERGVTDSLRQVHDWGRTAELRTLCKWTTFKTKHRTGLNKM